MLPRERVLKALAHEETDRVPIDFQCTLEVYSSVARYLGLSEEEKWDIPRLLHADIADFFRPQYIGKPLKTFEDGSYFSPMGHHMKSVTNDFCTYEEYASFPLEEAEMVEELEAYDWPDAKDYDYEGIVRQLKPAHETMCTRVWTGGPFELAWGVRGLEQFFVDMAIEPEIAHYILGKYTDFWMDYLDRLMEAAGDYIDIIFTHDDIASQNGMLMSTKMWEEFIKPCHVKIDKKIHSYGKIVHYHSCGNIFKKDILDGLVDMGVDILNPLQMCGDMTFEELKRDYGDKLSFHGGMNIQNFLPFCTPEEAKTEAHRIIDIMSKNGGYIFAPSHFLQNDIPAANIVAMYEAAAGVPIK